MRLVGKLAVYHVDAFTSEPFGGNPAGVIPQADGLKEQEMQKIARELNLSESAFLITATNPKADFKVRYFTPKAEIDFCGHATVGLSWLLANNYGWAERAEQVMLETNIGLVPVEWRKDNHSLQMVVMTQVSPQVKAVHVEYKDISRIIGVPEAELDKRYPIRLAYTGNWHLLIPIKSRTAIDAAKPLLDELAVLNQSQQAVTTHLFTFDTQMEGYDLYTRDFAPAIGIAEDPVTGAANGALAGYLVLENILPKQEIHELTIAQGHAIGRAGTLYVTITSTSSEPMIQVGGAAVPTISGTISF